MSDFDLGWGDEPRRHRGGRRYHAGGGRGQSRRRRAAEARRAARRGPGRTRRRGGCSILVTVVVLALFAALALGGYGTLRSYVFPPDYSGAGSGSVVVAIEKGATVSDIAETLEEKGVVKSARAFVVAARANDRGNAIQPGTYRLHMKMSANLAMSLLLDPASRVRVQVIIPEGLRLTQILHRIAKETNLSVKELRRAAKSPKELGVPPYAKGKLEGYLYPATYTLEPDMPPDDVLRTMVDRYKREAEDMNLVQRARKVNLTPLEAVTVASLVQAEGGRVSDFRKIARVIYNRLAVGRKLEFDSTVLYAHDKYGIIASHQDLRVDSPYNTYRYPGLPPGPICSPGRKALEAALNPAAGEWFWFVTTDPKRRITKFTDNVQQFQQFRQELQSNLQRDG